MDLSTATVAARLPCQDLERARRFYADTLGLEPVEEREGGLRYVLAGAEFCLFASTGRADGSFTQLAFTVHDAAATVAELRRRGVHFVSYDMPGTSTVDGLVTIDGQYPSKGSGERAAWFTDSEGNLLGLGEIVP